jgi:uncharacterized protein YjiS (DUF1127 family)
MSQSSVMEAPQTSAAAPAGRNVLSTWACSIETWFIRRQGWQELNSLGDRLLQDVGFSREDLSPEGRRAKLRAANLHD